MFVLLAIGVGIGWLTGLSVSPVISGVVTGVIGVAVAIISALAGVAQQEKMSNEQDKATENQDQIADKSKMQGNKPPTKVLPQNINTRPLMWLVIGLVAGSSLGVWARTHSWLGQNPQVEIWSTYGITPAKATTPDETLSNRLRKAITSEINFWSDNLKLDKAEVTQRLFDLQFPAITANEASQKSDVQVGGDASTPGLFVLGSLTESECDSLQNQSGVGKLRFEMERQDGKLEQLSTVLKATPQDSEEVSQVLDDKLEEVIELLCSEEP